MQHPTFTGTSRRQRQVNLSGRPSNPFSSSHASPKTGPQSAVASAQQDRIARQQQKERVQASSRIQRVWRGHYARQRTYRSWRRDWDQHEEQESVEHGAYRTSEESLRQLNRLLLFYNPYEDVERLTWYGLRQIATAEIIHCEESPWPAAYLRLVMACVAAFQVNKKAVEDLDKVLLTTLTFATRRTILTRRDAVSYYEALARLQGLSTDLLQNALVAPLARSPAAYAGLVVLLSHPLDLRILKLLRSSVDPTRLTQALLTSLAQRLTVSPRVRLWLLCNIIELSGETRTGDFIAVVAQLLGSLADDVDFEGQPLDLDNATFDSEVLSQAPNLMPLNNYMSERIGSLIDQSAVRNLLVRAENTPKDEGQSTQLLASYALTLLRCFPRRADDIRMWLYLGPQNSSDSNLPATRYFWKSARETPVFTTVWQNSRNVLALLQIPEPTPEMRNQWTVILVFLELYTFLLKIMDDEEFVGAGTQPSAIPLEDVADLVTFLKNLGFTLYFHASDLTTIHDPAIGNTDTVDLSRHFASTNKAPGPKAAEGRKTFVVAGLAGLTVDYLKGLITGLLRAIYERDSRRRFLPSDHWLMTSRFDMTSFIPGVVAEEEKRHLIQEQIDEDGGVESEEDELLSPRSRPRGHASALRSQAAQARAQRRMSKKRYLEAVAPHLEILQNMPFFIPFVTRVETFRQFVHLDQEKRRGGFTDPDLWRQSVLLNSPNGMPGRDVLSRHHAKIRRKNEFDDAFEQFYDLGPNLKEPIQITFVDEFDIPEAGIDGGGVTKEFLTSVINQAFDINSDRVERFFVENDKHLLYPNPTALDDLRAKWRDMGFADTDPQVRDEIRLFLQQYEFLGRVIGKCLYEGILVDVSFAGFFSKKWALTGGTGASPMESGYRANINDLRELDEGLYRGLLSLKKSPDVEQLGLTFTVDDVVGPDDRKTVVERELIPNGANTTVNSENRLVYINRMSWYRLQGQSAPQTNAFLKGLGSIIQPSWLNMFNQSELQTLIGGASASIDIQDLRKNTLYGGTYVIGDDGREHPSVRLFWDVMADLPDVDRRAVLKFVTSTPRGPLLGFGSLNPRFSIRDSGSDENRYPTTSTCVNLLKLPMYKSERVLREKLLAAVNSGAGFDLS